MAGRKSDDATVRSEGGACGASHLAHLLESQGTGLDNKYAEEPLALFSWVLMGEAGLTTMKRSVALVFNARGP
jgi:hypothetical protein